MQNSIRLVLILVFALVSNGQISRAAGVTIITHGYENGGGLPTWVSSMSEAIVARAGGQQNVAVYNMVLGEDSAGDPVVLIKSLSPASGSPIPTNTTTGEIIINVDWSDFSGGFDAGPIIGAMSTTYVAAAIVNALTNSVFQSASFSNITSPTGNPLVELPVHLIGHSRGGSLMAEIARLLGEDGIWVDQLTPLDPHPLNNNGDVDPFQEGTVDAPVAIYANVIFADNYYETTQLYPHGMFVNNATNEGPLVFDINDDTCH